MRDVICRNLTARGSVPRDFQPAPPMRGCWRRQPSSWRRKPDYKARACDRRFAVRAERPYAVLGPYPSAMGLHDLFGDRQPETRILAKTLVRPVGVEALEDPLQRILANPRSIVVDDDFNVGSHAPACDPHLAADFGK